MKKDALPLIAIVDDDEAIRESLSDYFHRSNYDVKTYKNGKDMLAAIDDYNINAIICDLKMPKMDGVSVLKALQLRKNAPPFIMITAHGNISSAVEAVKSGAYDFIPKPFDPKKLKEMVSQAIRKQQTKINKKHQLLGKSQQIKPFYSQILECANTNDNMMIAGEQGVGKSLIAETIHQHSARKENPFVGVSCNTLSDSMFDKKFLKANNIFLEAENGTIFLENLGQLPFEVHAKMRVLLKEKCAMRNRQSCPRIISSINTTPDKPEEGENLFQKYALLADTIINIPTLRDHKDDIAELFNLYMAQSAGHYQAPIPVLSEEDIIALTSFDWPGNQRQLKQIAEQFVLLNRTIQTSISYLLKVSPTDMIDMSNKFNKNLRTLMQDFECQLITQAMIECSGNISQVCDLLKTPRRTLNEKLLKHNITRSSFL